jgi:hypothetical protein
VEKQGQFYERARARARPYVAEISDLTGGGRLSSQFDTKIVEIAD